LEGLIEKFHVLNRDDLADALGEKLAQLGAISAKWAPDILFLLLQLSDQPATKAPEYTSPSPVDSTELPALTWEQVLENDPYSDDEIWNQPSYSPISSDSEHELSLPSLSPTSPTAPALHQETDDDTGPLDDLLIEPDTEILPALEKLQFWTQANSTTADGVGVVSSPQTIPELHVIREILLMLRGLPTSVFTISRQRTVAYCGGYGISNVTQPIFTSHLQAVAAAGTELLQVRDWCRQSWSDSLLQAFQAAVQTKLRQFDQRIGVLESSFVCAAEDTVVSLIDTLNTVTSLGKPLLAVRKLILNMSPLSKFSHLELLHDSICNYQATGDVENFECMGSIFFDSLQAFLRPIRKWMTEGVISHAHSAFFIVEKDGQLDNASIWHDQFHLRQSKSGQLLAPKFVHTSLKQILNAGKSIVFLEKLRVTTTFADAEHQTLDFESVCNSQDGYSLTPFPILFDRAFSEWIEGMYSPASSILRESLFNRYHFEKCLNALEEIYLSKDGTRLQAFADPMFEGIDDNSSTVQTSMLIY
jgi:gamma-tubulin complex component 5